MPRMPTYDEIRDDFERGVRTAEQYIEHPFRHNDEPRMAPHVEAALAARQTPAPAPATMAAATAAAPQQEEPMSLITAVEDGWNAVDAEYVKLKAALPGALAKAKQFEGSAFAQVAEKAAASILPPEAVAIAVNGADKVLDDLIALYGPAQAQQPPVAAPAQ